MFANQFHRRTAYIVAALCALALLFCLLAPSPAAAAAQLTTYKSADGRWTMQYPANVLSPEDLGNGTIVFISRDRAMFVAIDSYAAADKTSPADLRARAKRALTRIYGVTPRTIQPLSQLDYPWQAGVAFATAKGSEGLAVYTTDGSPAGAAIGELLGYKVKLSDTQREPLYQTLATFQLTGHRK